MFRLFVALIAAFSAPSAARASANQPLVPSIALEAPREGQWTVRYRLTKPVRQLLFVRSPDSSRSETWTVAEGFEIVRAGDSEVLRRRDGAAFNLASARVPPLYRDLPKDYAPFSPFGDGGILVHSGRYFACSEPCPDGARWAMSLAVTDGRKILVDGRAHEKSAQWEDGDSGRNVYVGSASPIESPDLVAVIDTALPPKIRGQLEAQLPLFMGYFSDKLGELPAKPMLFASYDVSHRPGFGRQGGTLPGQVFTHFYGDVWPSQMDQPSLAHELAWFFAHEAGHLYQRQLYSAEATGAWIHEGGADAFAAIALKAVNPALKGPLAELLEAKVKSCTKLLAGGSMHDALAAGRFDVAYDCGVLLNLSVHKALLAERPESGGLFAVWRYYIAASEAGGQPGEELFLASIGKAGGLELAEKVKAAVRAPVPPALELR